MNTQDDKASKIYLNLNSNTEKSSDLWNDLTKECQIIVNSHEFDMSKVKNIQERIRRSVVKDYLCEVHKYEWTKKFNSFINDEKQLVKRFEDVGYECILEKSVIKICYNKKPIILIPMPTLHQLMTNSTNLEDERNKSFYMFCIMNLNEDLFNKLTTLYGLKEYYKAVYEN